MYRKLGDGLFLDTCKEVAALYPKINFDSVIIDNACMQVGIIIDGPFSSFYMYM